MATVRDTSTENKIDIVTTTENNVTVTQPVTSIVTVSALGPQGAIGPQGPAGPLPDTGSFVLTSSFNSYTGSSDSQFAGTASFAVTASYAANVPLTASYALQALSASYALTASYIENAQTASYVTTAQTASYVLNAISASYSTQALSASYAISASHEIIKEVSSSHADFADTASLAYTASYALTASYLDNYVEPFPYTGSALITGSLGITGSLDVTDGITGSFTGSFVGDGSQLTGIDTGSWDGQYSGSAVITGSLVIEENSTTEALRVTQTGTGDAIRIEDSSNPDSTPTVITADGDILIGTGSATINNNKLYVKEGNAGSITPGTGNTIVVESSTTNYIGMFAPDASLSGIVMGSPSDGFGAFIRWGYTSGELRIGAAQTGHFLSFSVGNKTQTSMRLIPAGIGTSDPTSILEVTGSLIVTDSISSSFSGSFEGDGSGLTGINTGSWDGQYSGSAYITGSLQISSSGNQQLTLIGSGSSQPIFRVQGSEGELFSITDSLSGSLFAVNNISGLPILEVFSDDRIIQGDYAAPMLTTTVKNTVSAVGAFTVYELPTASYDGAFFEYTARSGSNARAGQIMSIWSGSQVNFTETTTTDFGSTTGLAFTMIVTGSNFALTGSVTTADWTIKTIVRSI